ncbi:uncharacterized protein LOC119692247 [Plutella xylostella]|uniref:uncharacterized protein LOC119692247 n=1 Tax=Plutella xylostella TaxID=51655 RepID=UPI002032FBB2|nr:uncharacterized protein LOC119692247 [Plutella xylostella]
MAKGTFNPKIVPKFWDRENGPHRVTKCYLKGVIFIGTRLYRCMALGIITSCTDPTCLEYICQLSVTSCQCDTGSAGYKQVGVYRRAKYTLLKMASPLTLESFDCEGEPGSVGVRWERWKRALFIYLDASNIEKDDKKRANLLHFGGIELQEIYYNIPEAHVEPAEGVNVFSVAIKKLDEYFAPKQSNIYERHMFRLLKQEKDEKFEKFVVRLRQQADKCQFTAKDENIIDQITEKCLSSELRKKILQIGDGITLDRIISEANLLEVVNKQLEKFGCTASSESINKIESKPKSKFEVSEKEEIGCGRCGNRRHSSNDPNCPAKRRECLKCGLLGHFRQFCKTRNITKRKWEGKNTREYDKRKKITLQTWAGLKQKMLVDSGCKQNLITEETWNKLKMHNVQVFNQIKNPNINFMSYGSDKPLEVKGSFEATIKVGNNSENATFYVIIKGTKNLLGKTTAVALGILRIGLDSVVGSVDTEVFPKFKDVLVDLPIDDSVSPVSQPYRRIPIPLEGKIEAKIQDLVNRDIIEEVKGSSRWVSPIVPILKDDGEVRLCIDMRRANAAIVRENHSLPTMDVMEKVNFLGHELSGEGIRPLEKYVSTIQEFRAPSTTGELQSFLGLVNFVSKWIPDLATRTESLKELLRSKKEHRPSSEIIEVKDRDKEMKEKGKEYADRKRKAKDCELELGDKVYIKNMSKDNKLSLNYDATPHTVEKTIGGDIEVRNDETGQTLRRNVVHLKKIQGNWEVVNRSENEQLQINGNTEDGATMEED